MTETTHEDLLADFTVSRPYTMDVVADAPRAAGVHVVVAGDTVIYVGRTSNLKDRLRQHLTGSRASSVLHDQVGQLLDGSGPVASAADIASWLGRCIVRWRESDDLVADEEALVRELKPRFNRQVPRPRG